jgi:hypothetical protein
MDVSTKKISESIGYKLREGFRISIEIVKKQISLIIDEDRLISDSKESVFYILS